MTKISEKYGRTDLLLKEIIQLKAKVKTRDKTIERLKANANLEQLKHDIRVICKDPKLDPIEKNNKIYSVTMQ